MLTIGGKDSFTVRIGNHVIIEFIRALVYASVVNVRAVKIDIKVWKI